LQSDAIATEQNINEEEKTTTESTDLQTESIDTQQQTQSSLSLAESSTITDSSSSESTNSLHPTLSIPSSESTVIGVVLEHKTDEQQRFINTETETIQSDTEHRSETIHSLPSDKRDVIDSWMNNRENSIAGYVCLITRKSRLSCSGYHFNKKSEYQI
jgi:hypothetical protein